MDILNLIYKFTKLVILYWIAQGIWMVDKHVRMIAILIDMMR